MKGKLIVVLGAGYVLGSRAGRQRYEQIKGAAERLWRDPRVQETASRAQHKVQQKAREQAPKMQESALRAAGSVRDVTFGRGGGG